MQKVIDYIEEHRKTYENHAFFTRLINDES